MNSMPLHQLAALVHAHNAADLASISLPCRRISTDSRAVESGDCFFAIKGERFDGHAFVDQAFDQGAVCAVVHKDYLRHRYKSDHPRPLLQVTDTVESLGYLAASYRQQGNFTVIGITGSVGKTSTRHILAHVLSCHFRVHQSPKNFNNTIGLPLTLLRADPKDQVIVAELGSSGLGEIGLLTRIAQPDIAIITNVHEAHLEGFGSIAAIAREKLSIAKGLSAQGTLILNANCAPLMLAAQQMSLSAVTFDPSGLPVTYSPTGSKVILNGTELTIPLPGPGNVSNTLAAWTAAQQMGLSLADFNDALQTLPAIDMRGHIMELGDLTVICDYYNASPASMTNALAILQAQSQPGQRRVLILGDMAELGSQSETLHRNLGRDIAEREVDVIIAVGALAGVAAQTAHAESNNQLQIHCFTDTMCACAELSSLIRSGDLILIKGSRSARLEQAVATLKAEYSSPNSTVR